MSTEALRLKTEDNPQKQIWQPGMPLNTCLIYRFFPRTFVERFDPRFLNSREETLKGVVTGLLYSPERNLWLGKAAIAPVVIHAQAAKLAQDDRNYEFKLPEHFSHSTAAAFSTLSMAANGKLETITALGRKRNEADREDYQTTIAVLGAIGRRLAHATEDAGYNLVMDEFDSQLPSNLRVVKGLIDIPDDKINIITDYGQPPARK